MTETLAGGITRLHNIASAQERLGVGRSKVFALIRPGELRSVQIGARRDRSPGIRSLSSCDSRAAIQLRLPRTVLISPLCAMSR